MIPSRGLRWSSQTIGIGRRRLEPFSVRLFSSSNVRQGQFRPNPFLSKNEPSTSRIYNTSRFSKSNTLIRNAVAVRFASTTPISSPIATAAPTTPIEDASSSDPLPDEFATSSLDGVSDFVPDDFMNMPEQIGYLKSIGLDYGSVPWPTATMEWFLEHIHVYAGTPWWISIILTTVAVRVILLKAYMGASDNGARMAAVRPLSEPLTKKMKAAAAIPGNTAEVMAIQMELKQINRRAGIKLWRSFAPMITIFTGYGLWKLLRGMSALPVPGLETGGILWFTNLTLPDPYLALPIVTSFVLHWVFRKGGELGTTAMHSTIMRFMSYFIPAISLAFTFWLPAAVQLSFVATGILSYIQSELFKNSAFRERFNMYPMHPVGTPGALGDLPYKGTINVKGRTLSQEDIKQTSTRSTGTQSPEFQAGKESLQNAKPRGAFGKVVDGALKDVKGTVTAVKKSASDVVEAGREQFGGSKAKQVNKEAKRYERKQSKEERREIKALQEQKRREWEEKKRMRAKR